MPIPPPPPPPPPPPSSAYGGGTIASKLPSKTNERTKLLSEIHAGAKLRKTTTNDRSAPLVGGRNPSNTASRGVGGTSTIRGGVSGGQGIAINTKSAGLFINGLPKKPSDIKKTALPNNDANQGVNRNHPRLPSQPKPASSSHVVDNKSNVNNLKAALNARYSKQNSSSAPNLDSAGAHSDSGVPSSFAERVQLLNQKLAPSGGMSSEPETSSNQANAVTCNSSSSISSRPPLAPPPTPPSAKAKPALPSVAPSVHKTTPPSSQFKTMRNDKNTSISDQRSQLRRSGSSEDIRSTPKLNTPPALPANPPNSSRIVKPAHRPPPPPGQPPRPSNQLFTSPSHPTPPPVPPQSSLPHAAPTYIHNSISNNNSSHTAPSTPSVPPSATQFNTNENDDDAPPRPPPRGASYGISSTTITTTTTKINKNFINNNNVIKNNNNTTTNNLMDRFEFIPISELPPPNLFTGFKKIYDGQSNKRNALNAVTG